MHRSNRDLRTKINAHISAILRISFDPLDLELSENAIKPHKDQKSRSEMTTPSACLTACVSTVLHGIASN